MSKVKRPKLSRYPKRPKASAPLSSWQRYDDRCHEVEKANNTKMSDHSKKLNGLAKNKKSKLAIIKKSAVRKGIALTKGSKR